MIQRNTPELFVADVDSAVRYYVDVLGFQPSGRAPDDPAQPAVWAEVQQGQASFMFEQAAEPRGSGGVAFYLQVDDVDRWHGELRRRGARIVEEPTERPYGMRELTVEDPSGYRLVFTAPVSAQV